MKTVRQLPSHLINQIAAGEVVERPSSVVKELVENALDADAKRVDVVIAEGGTARIEVSDDGHGMRPEDARLAVERHATSKIAHIDDLTSLTSFGFRGEALPSIASVSRFELVTRTAEDSAGIRLRSEGTSQWEQQPVSAPVGTRIEARDLFFNIPARRKFLKSVPTESAQVSDVILSQALAAPEVTFTLTRDGKKVREYLRTKNRHERAASALANETLTEFQFTRGALTVEAYLSHPERARMGAQGLHIIVNRRAVRDRALARAVALAYGSVLDGGKYPVGVLYLDLPEAFVDINVHPQKLEVRFRDARSVLDEVMRGLAPQVAKAFATPALLLARAAPQPLVLEQRAAPMPYGASAPISPGTEMALADEPSLFRSVQFYASLTFRTQVRNMFLVCEGRDGLYILDQHAAHERIVFHQLKTEQKHGGQPAMQTLLQSQVFDVSESDAEQIEGLADAFVRIGFEVQRLGPTSVSVSAIPAALHTTRLAELIRALLDETTGKGREFTERTDLLLATVACHGSIRAGDTVHPETAAALLAQLDAVDFAGYCPHGRPVVMRLGFDELERKVGR